MRNLLTTIAGAAFLTACGNAATPDVDTAPVETKVAAKAPYDINRQYAKFAEVPMNPDVSFLTDTDGNKNSVILPLNLLKNVDFIYFPDFWQSPSNSQSANPFNARNGALV